MGSIWSSLCVSAYSWLSDVQADNVCTVRTISTKSTWKCKDFLTDLWDGVMLPVFTVSLSEWG